MPRVWKQIIAPGVYWVRCLACSGSPDGQVNGKPCRLCGGVGSLPVEYTSHDCQEFHDNGKAMLLAGLPVPIPLEHDLTADPNTAAAASVAYNTGKVEDWRMGPDGSLWAELGVEVIPQPGKGADGQALPSIRDEAEIRHRLEKTIRHVSPMIDPSFRDSTGKVWRGITHIALTPQPVWTSAAPFSFAGSDGAVAMSRFSRRRVLQPYSWHLRGRQALSLANCWYCAPALSGAIPWDETAWPVLMAAAHAPKGGITIAGKFFPGGRFIPAGDVAKASPDQKKRLDEDQAGRKEKLRQIVGTPDHGALTDKVKPWNGLELKAHQLAEAKRTWASLKSYHGAEALHRLHQLVHQDTLKAENTPAGGARTRLERRLRAYGHMLEWHKAGEEKKAADFAASKRGVQSVPKGDLHIDPERFQYKLGVNKEGTVREGSAVEGVKRFRPEFAGVLLAWHDPVANKDFVVNGHHRYAIAKGDKSIDNLGVFFIDAKDAKEARKIGALANIAEGRGTPTDAAKLIRDHGFTPEDFKAEGVSLKGNISTPAFTLAKLSDGLFKKLTLGTLDEKQALAIGKIGNHEHQEQFAKWLDKQDRDIPDRVLERMASKIQNTSGAKTKTQTLFGEDEHDENLFLQRTTLETHILAKLSQEANLFGAVSTEKKAEALKQGAENQLDVGRNKEISDEARVHRALLAKLVDLKGPIADAFNHAAEELHASPKKRKHIEERLLGRVRDLAGTELAGGRAPAAAAGGENGAGGGSGLAAGAGASGGRAAPAGGVDEGETYYHGTWTPHTGFKKDRTFYVTKDKSYAGSYKREAGEMLNVRLKPHAKVFDTRKPEDLAIAKKLIEDHPSMGYWGADDFMKKKFKNGLPSWGASDLIDEVKKLGYDGMHINERHGDEPVESLAVFNPDSVDTKKENPPPEPRVAASHISPRPHGTPKNPPADLTRIPARAALSNRGGPMADDPKPKKKPEGDEGDGLFDEDDVSGEGDDEGSVDADGDGIPGDSQEDKVAAANIAGDNAMAGNGGDTAGKIAEVSKELAGLGIVIDPSKTPEDFLDHLVSSLKTHKATKSLNEPEPEETTPGADDMANQNQPGAQGAPEPNFVAMSNRVKTLERDNARYLAIAATNRLAEVDRDIDLIQQGEQISKETAAEWKSKLGAKKLSVARGDDAEISRILLKVETLKDACLVNPLLAERVAMSKNGSVVPRSREWEDPKNKQLTEEESDGAADEIMGKKTAKKAA